MVSELLENTMTGIAACCKAWELSLRRYSLLSRQGRCTTHAGGLLAGPAPTRRNSFARPVLPHGESMAGERLSTDVPSDLLRGVYTGFTQNVSSQGYVQRRRESLAHSVVWAATRQPRVRCCHGSGKETA
jgi:hypothetical protein